MADSSPPAYKHEWDPNYRPSPSAPSNKDDIELQVKGDHFHGGDVPENGYPSAAAGFPPPPMGGAYPPAGAPPYPTPSGPAYPPPSGALYPPRPGGAVYPPPAGPPPPTGPAYPPPGGYPPPPVDGYAYPPTTGAAAYPVPSAGQPPPPSQYQTYAPAQALVPQNDHHTQVTVIDREEYTGSVIIAHGNYDPETEEPEGDCSCFCCCSGLWHGGFFVWMGLFIWQSLEKSGDSDSDRYNSGLYISSGILMACSYLFMLFETCCSNTQEYLDHKYTLQEANAKVLENRKTKIGLKWYAECYHNETEHYTDSQGNGKTRTKRVTTETAKEEFYCNEVVDASKRFRSVNFKDGSVCRVSFHLSYGFADRASQDIYQRTKDEFYNRWKDFDEKYDFSESFTLSEDYPKHFTVFTRGDEDRFLMSRAVFWCCTFFMCSLPYRWWFRYKTGRAHYTYLKLMKI